MEPFVNLDDLPRSERKTFPPGSVHRNRGLWNCIMGTGYKLPVTPFKLNLDRALVWLACALIAVATAFGLCGLLVTLLHRGH